MENKLLTKGEYKVLMILISKRNKDGVINIAITPLPKLLQSLGYVNSTIYLHMRNLVRKGYVEWSKSFYVKILKEYEE